MKLKGLILLILISALLIVPVASAQDTLSADEVELLEFVAAAYSNMEALTGYSMQGSQATSQNITSTVGQTEVAIVQVIDQDLRGSIEFLGDGEAATQVEVIQNIQMDMPNQPQIVVDMTMEFIVVDGVAYVEVRDVAPAAVAASFPRGWINLNKDASSIPGMELLNSDQFAGMMTSPFVYNLTETTVTGITELDSEEIDGQSMRVFVVVVDVKALLEDEAVAEAMGLFNFEQLGVDMEKVLEAFGEDSSMKLTVWIGIDDNFVHRIDAEQRALLDFGPEVIGQAMTIDQTIGMSMSIANFNESFGITAPEE